jgi:hypothetical protein
MEFSLRRIVGYGCSFTAGEETTDHSIANISIEEMDVIKKDGGNRNVNIKYNDLLSAAMKKWVNNREELGEKISEFDIPREWTNYRYQQDNNYSYIRYLADMYNVPWKNRAIPGGSNEQMIYRMVNDSNNNVLQQGDMVIFGLTSFSRIFWLEKSYQGEIVEKQYVFSHLPSNENAKYQQLFDTYYSPYYIIWNVYQKIKLLISLGQELEQKGIKLVIIPILFNKDKDINDLILSDKEISPESVDWNPIEFLEKTNIFDNKYFKDIESYTEWEGNRTREGRVNMVHGWGHPTADSQKNYARTYLYNILNNDKWYHNNYKINKTKNYEDKLKLKLQELRKGDPFIYR